MLTTTNKKSKIPQQNSENSITIGIATTLEDKESIYRFRYQTYVEEMDKHFPGIDHHKKLLYDDRDKWALHISAKIGSKLIGTSQINIGKFNDFSREQAETFSLADFQNYPEIADRIFAFITKIMVTPAFRNTPALYLLMAKCAKIVYETNTKFVFGACNFHLLPLYEQLGFYRYTKNFFEPGSGLLVPLVSPINDIHHLHAVRSPLYRIARKRCEVTTTSVDWFYDKFINNSPIINTQLVTEENLWLALYEQLVYPPTQVISLLHKLTTEEAKIFLHNCGIYVHCYPGDQITTQGDVSYSYNILISGQLKSLTFCHPAKSYATPGQSFGANGLTEHNNHVEDIVATTPAEILVLSGIAFQRFYHTHPNIAHKLVQTMLNLKNNG